MASRLEMIRRQKQDLLFSPDDNEQIVNSLSDMSTHWSNDSNRVRAVPNDVDLPTPIEFINQPDADINELRDRHESIQLSEAREFYTSEPPPFLQPNANKTPPGTRVRAQLAKNGKLPARPLKVDVISRPWGNQGSYWTLDLEGQRLIVKTFPGGTPGGGYRQWGGISKGFSKIPVAFKISRRSNNVRASHRERQSGAKGGSDELERYNLRSSPASARRSAAKSTRSTISKAPRYCESTSSSNDTISSPELSDGWDASSAFSREYQISELGPRFTRRPSKVVKLHVSGELARLQLARVLRNSELRQTNGVGSNRTVQSHSNTDYAALEVGQSKHRIFDAQSHDFGHTFQRFMEPSQVSGNSHKDMTFSPKRMKHNANPELSIVKVVQKSPETAVGFPIEDILERQVEKTNRFTMKKSVGHQSPQTETTTPTLSLHKQERTTLCFFLPPDEDCVPFKLRSCMTMSTLFASAIGAFDLDDQVEKVRALRATFADVPKGYPTMSLLMKKALPDTHQIFLEFVEGLSVWDQGGTGTCTVRMEILIKGKSDG